MNEILSQKKVKHKSSRITSSPTSCLCTNELLHLLCVCSSVFFRINRQFASSDEVNGDMSLLDTCVSAGLTLLLMLLLPRCSYQSCTEGTPKQCVDAEFAPGTDLAGEGFDITKMERKGAFVLNMKLWKHKDKTCTLCRNPFLESRKQKLPLSVVDWRAKQACSVKVASTLHRSSESLVSASTNSVENDWGTNLDIDVGKKSVSLMLAGTHSKLADYSMGKTKSDKFSFTSHSMSCEFYR